MRQHVDWPECILAGCLLTILPSADAEYPSYRGATFGRRRLCLPCTDRSSLTIPLSSYVGILHSINSDDSTVSLENVRSFGTEDRKANADDFVPPSEQLYEYIVFRGTDVKDLRIEEAPAGPKESKLPAVPNDPAIVGVSLARSPTPLPAWPFHDEPFRM